MISGQPRTVLAEEVLGQDREVPFNMQDNTGRRNQLNIPQSSWSRAAKELDLHCYRYSKNCKNRSNFIQIRIFPDPVLKIRIRILLSSLDV